MGMARTEEDAAKVNVAACRFHFWRGSFGHRSECRLARLLKRALKGQSGADRAFIYGRQVNHGFHNDTTPRYDAAAAGWVGADAGVLQGGALALNSNVIGLKPGFLAALRAFQASIFDTQTPIVARQAHQL